MATTIYGRHTREKSWPDSNATISTIEKSPIDFKEFSGEPEDWTTWSKVHRDQLLALGCADALTGAAGDETEVNRDDFDRGSVEPDRLRKPQQAWVSLVTSCKGVAFDIVNTEESASEAWVKLVQHYQASGLKERRRSPLTSTRWKWRWEKIRESSCFAWINH